MSAITGIFMRNGKDVDPELMKKMNKKLSHRGPDGSAIWCDGPMGLGHQMLWTTQESLKEKLPLEENNLVITADARIDNRDELSKELGLRDEEDVSDSYFILKAYEMWGDDCPDKLLGDFAFAIWDKEKEKLFCARDHMGVKPFYYYLDDDMFVFGTEIKALFCVDGVPRELNENRLSLFFTGNDLSEKKTTFYKNINSLSHSHFILVYKNKHENEKYWELNHDAEIRLDSDNDYAKEFEKIFAESVKCRLRSWTPLGIMLSGGIDSSSVTCMVNKIFKENNCQNKVHTFSYVFDDYPNIDERDFIESVLNIVDVESHYIICDDISPLIKIEEKIKFHDQPLSTYNIAMIHKSNKMINKNGIRVLLTGEGGDQVVSHGTNYLEELLCHFKLNKFLDNISNISDLYNISKTKLIFNTLYHIFHFYVFKLKIFLYDFKYSDDILNKKFLKKTKLNKLLKKLELYNIHNEKQSHYYFIKQGLQYGFEMLDQDSSIYNIELRHPFFDKRLIEFCYGIPSEMKIKYGFSRYVLRIGMENILPRKIQWRLEKSKMGFVGANNFLLEKKIIEKTILDQDNIIQEYIDLKKLQKAFNASLENKTAKTTIYIWRITLFYYWLLNRKKFNL